MASLKYGLETIELGSVAWRVIHNNNMEAIIEEFDNLEDNKANKDLSNVSDDDFHSKMLQNDNGFVRSNKTNKTIPFEITNIADDYTTNLDRVVLVDTSSKAITVTLSSNDVNFQGFITIKDKSGNAVSNNITIQTENDETIDGADNVVINTNYGYINLISDGNNWFIVGKG